MIPAFGCTAQQVLESDNFEELSNYIDVIEFGGFALVHECIGS
jgi:hypothetical protein